MSLNPSEREILRGMIPELEAEGYEVYVSPSPPLAPAFLQDFRADVIAFGKHKNLLIEFVHEASQDGGKLERIRRLIKDRPDWELRAVLVSPATTPRSLAVQSAEAIAENIEEMGQLTAQGFLRAALLSGWATFEALARALMTEEFRKPQTPGRLIGLLSEAGYLTPSEADRMRDLAKARNAFIHGELNTDISEDELRIFIAILSTLAGMAADAMEPDRKPN
jgi:uncharacterized protein YutE (UPF0331/DUF86 family)